MSEIGCTCSGQVGEAQRELLLPPGPGTLQREGQWLFHKGLWIKFVEFPLLSVLSHSRAQYRTSLWSPHSTSSWVLFTIPWCSRVHLPKGFLWQNVIGKMHLWTIWNEAMKGQRKVSGLFPLGKGEKTHPLNGHGTPSIDKIIFVDSKKRLEWWELSAALLISHI